MRCFFSSKNVINFEYLAILHIQPLNSQSNKFYLHSRMLWISALPLPPPSVQSCNFSDISNYIDLMKCHLPCHPSIRPLMYRIYNVYAKANQFNVHGKPCIHNIHCCASHTRNQMNVCGVESPWCCKNHHRKVVAKAKKKVESSSEEKKNKRKTHRFTLYSTNERAKKRRILFNWHCGSSKWNFVAINTTQKQWSSNSEKSSELSREL